MFAAAATSLNEALIAARPSRVRVEKMELVREQSAPIR